MSLRLPTPPYRLCSAYESELSLHTGLTDASGDSDPDIEFSKEVFMRRRAPSIDSLPPPEAILNAVQVPSHATPVTAHQERREFRTPRAGYLGLQPGLIVPQQAQDQDVDWPRDWRTVTLDRKSSQVMLADYNYHTDELQGNDFNWSPLSRHYQRLHASQSQDFPNHEHPHHVGSLRPASFESRQYDDDHTAHAGLRSGSFVQDSAGHTGDFQSSDGHLAGTSHGHPHDNGSIGIPHSESIDIVDDPPPVKKKRGRPKKPKPKVDELVTKSATSSPEPSDEPEWHFELLLHLSKPETGKKKGSARGQKDPEKRGPANVPSTTGWSEFLRTCALLVPTTTAGLYTHSFEWRFLRPATGPWLPVTNANGYQSMLGQAKQQRTKTPPYIIVRMTKPVQKLELEDVDEDSDSESDTGPMRKKGKIDEELGTIVESILKRYCVGQCEKHPLLHCFHHRVLDLHFELTRPRCLTWARDIRNGKPGVGYDKVPIGSGLFTAQHALPKISTTPAAPIAPGTPLTPAAVHPVMQNGYSGSPMMPFNPYGMIPPMQPMYPYPMMPMHHGWPSPIPVASGSGSSHARPSPPHSSPPPEIEGYTLQDFCADYGLNNDIEIGLTRLGYEPGASLLEVTLEDWRDAGIKAVQRGLILRAHKKFKNHKV
ncbi:hypothetical protein BDP27DRAFT_1363409 [Rhodocollybia butyracea]|uniref:SAM domain-containing protein n=1 Tax=Rhodocollybia butyracea TaxID=206335 RepID=A0A9P5U833_9AGAR|nr:hypothetical protein BDP27DRAFT_1363409 [Rhodocollybia butyracea]